MRTFSFFLFLVMGEGVFTSNLTLFGHYYDTDKIIFMLLIWVCLVQVGIEAWKSARDSTGLTPNDYACLRGRNSYIQLVQKKLSKKSESRHVVLDIHGAVLDCNNKWKQSDGYKSSKVASLQTEKIEMGATYRHCNLCQQKLAYGNIRRRSLAYQPAMLSMVAIAAVCVCVALLFKSSPEVLYVFQPFTWERLKYGAS